MDPAEVEGFGAVVRVEAEKLNPWRRKAIEELIGSVGNAEKARPAVPNVVRAALLRDEHYNNQAYKDQLIRTQILSLAAILAAVIAGVMVLLYNRLLYLGPEPAPATFSTLAAVMLFGNLGGTISAMLRASDSMAAARIPELTSANRVTFMRILMGGASAVVVYLVLQSQFTAIFNQDFARTMSGLKPQTTYVVAFVAGFSERLVLRAVEYVAGKQSTTETDKAKAAPPAK